MSELADRRKEAVEKYFKELFDRLDSIALFGPDEEMKADMKRDADELVEYNRLGQTLKSCSHCNNTAELRKHWNLEYPADVYVECIRCGLRTKGFVEFVDNTYSLIESTKKAVEAWNDRKGIK